MEGSPLDSFQSVRHFLHQRSRLGRGLWSRRNTKNVSDDPEMVACTYSSKCYCGIVFKRRDCDCIVNVRNSARLSLVENLQ